MSYKKSVPGRKRPISRVAFIGTYVPRKCGIATFTHDIATAVSDAGVDTQVIALNDRPEGYDYPSIVSHQLYQHDLDKYSEAAEYLNWQDLDVVCVQHEFGIYGGNAGRHLLTLLQELKAPVVTTFHTILENPSPAQYDVVVELCQLSARVIVMSHRGKQIMESTYGIDSELIAIVPHGIPVVDELRTPTIDEQQILTFGLIGPSKGIENMIEALPAIVEKHPKVKYVVAGATHPHIVAHSGEAYRESLLARADELGVAGNVKFINEFLSLDDLKILLQDASVYVTPYRNREQITSGTLAYAFGCGNAVVSTPYWHAEELLGDGRGVLVPFLDSMALADAINELLSDRKRLVEMQKNAFEIGRKMQWPNVALSYISLFAEAHEAVRRFLPVILEPVVIRRDVVSAMPPLNLSHLLAMTDGTGLIQHATYCIPNRFEGYCTDDNARGAILAIRLQETGEAAVGRRLQVRFLSFLHHAFNPANGRMRNFMSFERQWLEEAGSTDSHARAMWALGVLYAESDMPSLRPLAKDIFDRALPAAVPCTSLRSWANTILGLERMMVHHPNDPTYRAAMKTLADKIVNCYSQVSSPDWPWYENKLTYDNARIPHAMLLAGAVLGNSKLTKIGLETLTWLTQAQTAEDGKFVPIGSNGFYSRGGKSAKYDQQPIEAATTIDACEAAFQLTGDLVWIVEMERAFSWFCGVNSAGMKVFDAETGACGDAVTPNGINANSGAESTLAFLTSRLVVDRCRRANDGKATGAKSGGAYIG